jgi:hypothetical protein
MRRLAAICVVVLTALLAVAVARGQLIQQGNLRVSFSGTLLPHALPRTEAAPVRVHLDGSVATTDGTRPPSLRKLTIEVNRAGRVSTAGLPVCDAGELQQTTSQAALRNCRRALVGHGSFVANVNFASTPLIPAQGSVLAFNTRIHGKPGMLLHIYGSVPVRLTFVLPLEISRRSHGEFGTVFSARIPRIASGLGYVTGIKLVLGRRYPYQGRRRSFISASCAAPAGFPGAIYQLAHATFSFANGQRLESDLEGNCQVR